MAVYVLVAGGYCGGWAWREVVALLRAVGHEVHTPTLTGLGERVHLAHPCVDLDTHITDIVNVLAYEELVDVILVGASYGGMVITGVADGVSERLAHLVYVDAFVPEDGESLVDVVGRTSEVAQRWLRVEESGEWQIPPPPDDPRCVPHPLGTALQPISLSSKEAGRIPTTFIRCTGSDAGGQVDSLEASAERAKSRGWRYRELASAHSAYWDMPEGVVRLLLEAAELADDD